MNPLQPFLTLAGKALDPARDLVTLATAGALRPLPPQTVVALGRQLLAEGLKPHVVYTIHGTRDPDKPAIVSSRGITTWGELLDRMRRLANHMLATGLGPGDGVAIMLPNCPEFIETQAAAARIGATTSYINPRAPEQDARALLDRTKARLLVTHRPEVGQDIAVLVPGDTFERVIALAPADEPRVPREAEGRIVVFTSGTTGRPKGAVRSLAGGTSLHTLAGFLRAIPFRTSDIHLVVCPLYHSSGSGFASIAQVMGNPMVIVDRFSPEAFCAAVADHRVTTTAVVPTMLHQLCDWRHAKDYDLRSLRVVVCTGAPLREETRARARDLLGDVIYDLYGSTEMGWVSVAAPADQRAAPGTVGKPVEGVTVRIYDPSGREVARGERGEIFAGNEITMEGYLDDDVLTAERMRDGLVSVRDVGFIDGRGYLHVVDRADDMIISGGVNVYPAEAEIAMGAHPAISEVAVVGVPDEKWGQRIVAAAVLSGNVTSEELLAWCKERLSYAAVPKEIRFVDALPRNDVGKVDKRRITEGWHVDA